MRFLRLFVLAMLSAGSFAQSPTILNNLDESAWLTCGACGNSGGTGTVASYSATQESVFSRDGVASQFYLNPGAKYLNAYWYQTRPVDPNVTTFVYEFDQYIPIYYASSPQCIEFEIQPMVGGYTYNGAWQARWSNKRWYVFNYVTRVWEATTVPVNFTPGTWSHIKATYHIDPVKHVIVHDTLVVDGAVSAVNLSHYAKYTGSTKNVVNNAYQLDGKPGNTYSVFVDKMTLTGF